MVRDQRQMVRMLKEIAEEQAQTIHILSDDWIIILNDGTHDMYIFGYKYPNNNAAIEHICDDKVGLAAVLELKKVPVVPHVYFEAPLNNSYVDPEKDKLARAELIKQWGTVVVKPNEGTGGQNVYKAQNVEDLENACRTVFEYSRSCAICPFREIEHEYRAIVLNDEVRLLFEKIRPSIVGNGCDTIIELVRKQIGNYPIERLNTNKVIPAGERYTVQWKHNLGQGGSAEIVSSDELKGKLAKIAINVTKTIKANFVSVDIIQSTNGFEVLEVNSGVMMEHFAKSSKKNYEIAKNIYRDAVNSYLSSLHPQFYYERQPKTRFVLPIIEKVADINGVEVIKDSVNGAFGILSFSKNKYFVVKDFPFNVNISGSVQLCKNKSACSYFLKMLGFSVPKEKFFIKRGDIWETINEVSEYIKEPNINLGFSFPMVLKPNSLSQGTGVYKIDNYDDGMRVIKRIQDVPDRVFLLQQYIPGHDCRIVVLQGRIIQAYERHPFSIVGNGVDSVEVLLKKKNEQLMQAKRDKYVDISDERIFKRIQQNGLDMNSIVDNNATIELQDIRNLSLGGYAEDIEHILSEHIKNVAIDVAKKLNLTLCGIDMRIDDLQGKEYTIIEVNSAPGLDNYLYRGEEREKYLEKLYGSVLTELERQL